MCPALPPTRRPFAAIAAVCFVIVLAGCEVETTLTIEVREDGSGVVRVDVALDADAVAEAEVAGGSLEDRIRLDDLDAAGWRSTGWQRQEGGGACLRISKEFAEPGDLAGVIAELNGPDGPVRDIELSRDEGIFQTEYELDGVADLSALQTGVTTDAELVANLTAEQVDLAALDQRLLDQINQSFTLRVKVELPGGTNTFEPAPGETVDLGTSSDQLDPARPILIGAAALLGLIALVVFVRGERRDARRRRRARRIARRRPTGDPGPPNR